jgi:hypothetical protein
VVGDPAGADERGRDHMDSTYNLCGGFKPTIKRVADLDGPDFYPTPAWATRALIDNERFHGEVWECACGDGATVHQSHHVGDYVASIAPHLAASVRMTGPLAVYAQAQSGTRSAAADISQANAPLTMPSTAGGACDPDAAYDPDRPCAPITTLADAPVKAAAYQGCDADAAYDSSRSCSRTAGNATLGVPTATASKSSLYQPMASVAPANVPAASIPRSGTSIAVISGIWAIQVGAFSSPIRARAAVIGVHDALADLLGTARIELLPTSPLAARFCIVRNLGIYPPMQQAQLAPDWRPSCSPV